MRASNLALSATVLLVGAILSGAALPEKIVKEATPGCLSKEWMQRLWDALEAEDEAAFKALAHEGVSTRECLVWKKGTRVKVAGENKTPALLCVRRFGSTAPCYWTFAFDLSEGR